MTLRVKTLAHQILIFAVLLMTAMPSPAQRTEMVIYGGPGHETYLGCLTCIRFDPDSVCRSGGRYGSPLSPESIWNSGGRYGGQFSPSSPWNRFAKHPPVVFDKAGNRYGRFWVNTPQRFRPDIRALLEHMSDPNDFDDALVEARNRFCQH